MDIVLLFSKKWTLNIKMKCSFCSILDLELKSLHLKEALDKSEKH